MGSLFKKTVTRPLPPAAEIITRQGEGLVRWRDGKGKMRTAPLTTGQNGADRSPDESGTYASRYGDGKYLSLRFPTPLLFLSTRESSSRHSSRKCGSSA
jgi:hypothetical protein